ncbi:AAA family ATPase [Candidatus Fermentibacteria bacterium]|nr:AAA family ATPase [Candidatus Fermentibacteria bacterium]
MNYGTARTVVAEWLDRDGFPELIERSFPSTESPLAGTVLALVGPRRSGKTFLMYQMCRKIDSSGSSLLVDMEDYRFVSMEPGDIELLLKAYREFTGEEPTHLFLDEIHALPQWSRVLRTLCNRRKYSIVVSGSNAALLEREISTELRGRYSARHVYPLSFSEFLKFKGIEYDRLSFDTDKSGVLSGSLREYIAVGGFPEVVLAGSDLRRKELLTSYFQTVFLSDLIDRYEIHSTGLMRMLMEHLLTSFATPMSISKFTKRLNASGTPASKKTISAFLDYMEEVFFAFTLQICTSSARKRRLNPKKAYLVDHGFAVVPQRYSENLGLLLENVIAIHLLRKGEKLCYFHDNGDCDFVFGEPGISVEALQVYWALNEGSRDREIGGLLRASEQTGADKLTVVTADQRMTISRGGMEIRVVPAWQWLLSKDP